MHRTRTPHVCTHVCNGRTRTAHKRIGFYIQTSWHIKAHSFLHARMVHVYGVCVACAQFILPMRVHVRCTRTCAVHACLVHSVRKSPNWLRALCTTHVHFAQRTRAPRSHECTIHSRVHCTHTHRLFDTHTACAHVCTVHTRVVVRKELF